MTGFLASFKAEVRKMRRRPAIWICAGILVALLILLGYVISYVIYSHPPKGSAQQLPRGVTYDMFKVGLYPAHFVQNTLNGGAQLGGVMALIMGVLVQGSEYGWGTFKTVFTQRPRRLEVFAGRLVAVILVMLLLVLVLFALAAGLSYVIATIDGKSTAYPPAVDVLKGVLAMWLILSFWAVFGIALATVFQQSALAIGLGLAYALVIEALLFGILAGVSGDWVNQVRQWFPITNAGYLRAAFGQAVTIPGQPSESPFADATHAVVMLFVYLGVFTGVSAYLTRRRDVI